MQIPILNGVYTDEAADFRTSYPRNMIPVPKGQGISEGYLRPAEGIIEIGTGPGIDRGAEVWNGVHYRVMGGKLGKVSATGSFTEIGDIGGAEQVKMDYSFDRLAIVAGGSLYYYNGSTLSKVSDADLGTVIDVVFIDGYFILTDGESLIQSELNDPAEFNPLKYGSSEADPDPVVAVTKLRNELYAINRYSVEQFNNVSGSLFAFQRNEGAFMERGCIGTCAYAVYMDALAFLGGARNEPPAVWLGLNGSTTKISTQEIDTILLDYTDAELSAVIVETRKSKSHDWLYVHLPDRTLVYDGSASQAVQQPVWFELSSSVVGRGIYRARNFVWCYDQWQCADPTSTKLGVMTLDVSTHYGQTIGWEFATSIVYNASLGAIFHQLELVSLPGRVVLGADPIMWTSYSLDGENWSMERSCKVGKQGDRLRRITWLREGSMRNWRIQKFRGTSDAHLSVARLEAQLEGLNG